MSLSPCTGAALGSRCARAGLAEQCQYDVVGTRDGAAGSMRAHETRQEDGSRFGVHDDSFGDVPNTNAINERAGFFSLHGLVALQLSEGRPDLEDRPLFAHATQMPMFRDVDVPTPARFSDGHVSDRDPSSLPARHGANNMER